MSKDRINIPVEVTGANEAQDQLRDVKGAVEDVGQADQRHATSKGKVAEKTEGAAKAQDKFNDSARTALTGVLGRLSPEMASLATVAVDVAKGIGQASVALLGMLGAGAALGGMVMAFRKIAAATERAARAAERGVAAARKMREEGASRRREVAEQLRDAGVGASAAGPIARRAAMRQHAEGVPFEVTTQAEIARRLYGLDDDQVRDIERGMIVADTGGGFGRDRAENQKLLQTLRRAAATEGARAFAEQYRREVKLGEQGEAVPPGATQEDPAAVVRKYLVEKLGAISTREGDVGYRIMRGEGPRAFTTGFQRAQALSGEGTDTREEIDRALWSLTPTGDADRSLREIKDLFERTMEALGATREGPRSESPVRVNFTVNTTNIDSMYGGEPKPNYGRMALEEEYPRTD